MMMITYLYILVPIMIFFVTWLKNYIGIPMLVILSYGFYKLYKDNYKYEKKYMEISYKKILVLILFVFFITYLSGQGGFYFQYNDNNWRNAVYHDLIDYKWPVIYENTTGNSLVYYIMYWIFPAFISKVFVNFSNGFIIARIILFIWTFIGIMLVMLLLLNYLKAEKKKAFYIVLFVFLGWSGINIIGSIIYNTLGLSDFALNTYLWWTNFIVDNQPYSYMYRSNFDQLASVYNQTIVPWMIVILIMENRRIKNFAFLGLCALPYAPLPFLGIFMFMVAIAIPYYYKNCYEENKYKEAIKETLSIPNICSICTIFIVFFFYFRCNVAYSEGVGAVKNGFYVPLKEYTPFRIITLMLFYILSFGIYMFIIRQDYKKDYLFKVFAILLIIIPFFRIGNLAEFCWNVSAPIYFLVMMYVIKYMIKKIEIDKMINYNVVMLIVCLSLAYLNPISQVAFGAKIAIKEKTVLLMTDNVKTFSDKQVFDKNVEFTYNFVCPEPKEKFFYKYLAK
ncbi:MAG: hypothetical protein LKH84_08210 [Clostridium beijerinckii]|jgi:hypothetical protein|nr:hypothetical protein [Clostridium beijerinckii]